MATATHTRPDDTGGAGGAHAPPLVLLVGGSSETAAQIESAVASMAVSVQRVDSPEAALEAVTSKEFAVAVIDAQMPNIDVPALAKRLNDSQLAGLTPIILMTHPEDARRRRPDGYELGVVDYLCMPLDSAELGAKVGAFVRFHRILETERSRLGAIFRNAPAFLAVLRGPDHVFELVNEAYYQLIGHREVLGKPVFDALPDVRGQGFEAILDRVLETGEPYIGREEPITLERTPGAPSEERFLDFTYLPLTEVDGTRSGVIAYGLDVTDHVAARKDVERARDRIARLQAMTAALARATTPAGVADVVVAQGMSATGAATSFFALRDVNEPQHVVALRTSGFPDEVRDAWSSFHTWADAPLAFSIRTGATCFIESEAELRERFPALLDVWNRLGTHALAVIPINAGADTLGAISFSFTTPRTFTAEDRDFFGTLARQSALGLERARLITALTHEREFAVRARTDAELARAEWERAASAKGQFLATMSHELRTPINAQIGYTQLLQLGVAGPVTAEQREYLERLGRNSEHLLSLVNDVLDLSRIEAHQLTAVREDARTGTVVDAAMDVVRPLAAARGIRLDDSRPNPDGVPYVGDEQRVRQVLVNLLSNAVKFTEPGGRIEIACRSEAEAPEGTALHGQGPWAAVNVRDTGIGIEPNQLALIFEPFHQVQSGHTRTQGGTGLGLAISRRLARIMGGDLTVESAKGQGSNFTLWLPASAATPDAATPPETAEHRAARAERSAKGREAPGAERVGSTLRASVGEIMRNYVSALRGDSEVPEAHDMSTPEAEDHSHTLLADMAQAMFIVAAGGTEATSLLRDGSAIQRTIAEHHGRRRRRQGFSERALQRDVAILREEVTRVMRARLWSATDSAPAPDPSRALDGALEILFGFLDQAASLSMRAWRGAAQS
jgi:signal transduction histidine kinase